MRAGTIKFILLIDCAIGVLAALLISAGFSSNHIQTASAEDCEALISDKRLGGDDEFSGTLCINGIEAPYDEKTQTYYVPQSLKTEGYDGKLTWESLHERAYLIADAEFSNKESAIASGERFQLVTVSGGAYSEQSVVFTGLPMCVLDTDAESQARFGDDEKSGGWMRIYEPEGGTDGGYRISTHNIAYKPRGNSSANNPKQQYSVWFFTSNKEATAVETLGLRKADTIFFNSMYGDESKVRDKLSYDIWESLAGASPGRGNPAASRYTYAEMLEEGEYAGLFGVMDRCAEEEATQWGESTVIYKLSTRLMEYCKNPDRFEPDNPKLDECHSVKILYPKRTEPSDWDYIIDYANTVFLQGVNADPEDVLSRACLENLIDYSLYVQAIAGLDNIELNMIWYAKPQKDGYVMHRAPWDLDCTFGKEHNLTWRTDMGFAKMQFEQMEIQALQKSRPEWINPMLAERWEALRKGPFSEKEIFGMLAAERRKITASGALARDTARWPECGNTADVSDIEAFIRLRLEYLDAYYAGLIQ